MVLYYTGRGFLYNIQVEGYIFAIYGGGIYSKQLGLYLQYTGGCISLYRGGGVIILYRLGVYLNFTGKL